MNSFAVFTFVACLAAANASWLHGPSALVLQGPSSKTTLVGPEGSHISAVAPGGQIVHEEHPGFIAHAAPVHAHIAAHHAPIVAHAAPIVAHHAHAAPSTIVAHSSAYEHDNVLVAGPSGTISTGHSAHAPIVAHAAPIVAHAAPIVAHAAPIVAHAASIVAHSASIVALSGHDIHGHEGQYVHDHSEALYDDGSYKPHLYHH